MGTLILRVLCLIYTYTLPVRQVSILYTAFFRFHLTMDTLAFSNGSPYQSP